MDMGAPVTFDRVRLQEYVALGQRVSLFEIEAFAGGAWTRIATGTTIGHTRIVATAVTTASRVRVRIHDARGRPDDCFAVPPRFVAGQRQRSGGAPAHQDAAAQPATSMNRRHCCDAVRDAALAAALARPTARTGAWRAAADRVIVISLDGVRTQEMFGGLDVDDPSARARAEEEGRGASAVQDLLASDTRSAARGADAVPVGHVPEAAWVDRRRPPGRQRDDAGEHAALQLSGLCGVDDRRRRTTRVIDSNDNRRYPFETVLQFLRREFAATREQVACFGSWDVFTSIPSSTGGDVFTNAGYQTYDVPDARLQALSAAQFETVPPGTRPATTTTPGSSPSIICVRHQPRALWIGLDETDDWSHNGSYVRVIEYLHRFDGWLATLWALDRVDTGVPWPYGRDAGHRPRARQHQRGLGQPRQGHRGRAVRLGRGRCTDMAGSRASGRQGIRRRRRVRWRRRGVPGRQGLAAGLAGGGRAAGTSGLSPQPSGTWGAA